MWETLLREINGDQINGGTCHVHAWVGQFDITETWNWFIDSIQFQSKPWWFFSYINWQAGYNIYMEILKKGAKARGLTRY